MNTDTLETQTATTSAAPSVLTEVKALDMPDMAVEVRRADSALRMSNSMQVTSVEEFNLAAEELAEIKGRINALEAKRMKVAGPLHKAWTAFNQMFKAPMDTLKEAEASIKSAMLTFSNEQDRLAAIAKREADDLAAKERKKLEDAARLVEQEAADKRKKLADDEAARVKKANDEREQLEQQARDAEAKGDTAALDAINQQTATLDDNNDLAAQQAREESEQVDQAATAQSASLKMEAAVMSSAVVRMPVAAAKGVSKSTTWDYELIDMKQVVAHIAAHPDLANLLVLDSVKTRNYVKSLGENCKVPGLRVFAKSTLSSRAA